MYCRCELSIDSTQFQQLVSLKLHWSSAEHDLSTTDRVMSKVGQGGIEWNPNLMIVTIFFILEKLTVKMVSIGLIFNRRSGHYILHIYVPSLSLVILSWLSFLMSPSDIANRLALVTTMLVSMVFLHGETNTSLPPVSYAKASDWFVLVSFAFILLTLLESSWVYRTARTFTSETGSKQVVSLSKHFTFLM